MYTVGVDNAKTLTQMTAEVVENSQAKGWYDKPVMFPEAMALLHSEVSEALEAWRHWGLNDHTDLQSEQDKLDGILPKPEGVGNEFADVFIRLLDYSHRFGVNLETDASPGRFGINDLFSVNMNALHDMISKASMEQDSGEQWRVPHRFTDILTFLRQLCEEYSIDLQAEYEKKMQFNRSRQYRHGGKRI